MTPVDLDKDNKPGYRIKWRLLKRFKWRWEVTQIEPSTPGSTLQLDGSPSNTADPVALLPHPSLFQLSRQRGADGGGGIGVLSCAHLSHRHTSITGPVLISLLFCHANYGALVKRPPRVLNDRESIERGQEGGAREGGGGGI